MEKRAFKRIPSFFDVKLFYDDIVYDALILNLSQNGIYFSAGAYLSSGLNIKISMPLECQEVTVPFKIVRMSMIGRISFSCGAELLSPSHEYTKFIHSRLS